MNAGKRKQKIQNELSSLRMKNAGGCWICRSTSGVKVGREGYAPLCRKCTDAGKESADATRFEELKLELEKLNGQRR